MIQPCTRQKMNGITIAFAYDGWLQPHFCVRKSTTANFFLVFPLKR